MELAPAYRTKVLRSLIAYCDPAHHFHLLPAPTSNVPYMAAAPSELRSYAVRLAIGSQKVKQAPPPSRLHASMRPP